MYRCAHVRMRMCSMFQRRRRGCVLACSDGWCVGVIRRALCGQLIRRVVRAQVLRQAVCGEVMQ